MKTQRTLIFVGAHPDDESFNVGATLAHYAITGVKVYYICATRGEVGNAKSEKNIRFSTISELRSAELESAAQVLGLTDVIHLDYRDSGMKGWEDNKHPLALISVPLEEVTGRIVKLFRKLKPDVVITFDPIGGYRHPDHIITHNATVKAFYVAGDAKQYPKSGPSHQPQKLYFSITPRRITRMIVQFNSFLGLDMQKVGKNKNVDMEEITKIKFPIHAVIVPSKKAIEAEKKAIRCHASMFREAPPHFHILNIVTKILGHRDYYMREYPPVKSWIREHDLFKGIK
jgi:N-acetyl-1-D-myo-inositol-2-amino-2-deoxy-alpha-D-glucopyranoside deacetylase/mycothiol S-conjugate amidase